MPNASIEYAIMLPILIVQVILIPVSASWMIDGWTTRRREISLQDVASHLATTIQQLYFSLDSEDVTAGITTQAANVPAHVEFIPYRIQATDSKFENTTTIHLNLTLIGTSVKSIDRIILGPNASWEEGSVFQSNSTNPRIEVEKFDNGTLQFSFGGSS
jgi:hypothetical protein